MRDHPNFYTRTFIKPELKQCVGDYTYGNPEISGADPRYLKIGKFTSIAGDVKILTGADHNYTNFTNYPFDSISYNGKKLWKVKNDQVNTTEKIKGVVIGNDVWIGCRVTILNGVTIGDGAVIGAGSVVSKDIPPYAIAYGVPIEVRKYRFTGIDIQKMLKIAWWNWDDAKIEEALQFFNEGVEAFIAKYENTVAGV